MVSATRTGGESFEQTGFVLAGMDRDQPAPVVREATATDTDSVLAEVGYDAEAIADLRARGAVA